MNPEDADNKAGAETDGESGEKPTSERIAAEVGGLAAILKARGKLRSDQGHDAEPPAAPEEEPPA